MRRWLPVLLCVLLMVPLLGCWDLHELNSVAIVTGMAIDRGEKHAYKLSVEALNGTEVAGKKAQGGAPVTVFSLEGDSLSELAHRMNVGLTRKLIYSHMRVLAIADSLAKEGLLDFLDFMERDHEIRDDFNLLIVRGSTAEKVISTTYPLQKVPSIKIHMQIDTMYHEWGGDPKVRMKEFIAAMTSKGREPVAEMVTIQGDPKAGNSVENNRTLKPDALVVLDGMAVFRREKMIGTLGLQDVQNYVWTQNLLKNASIHVPCTAEESFDLRIYNSQTHVKTRYANGAPQVEIRIDMEAYLNGTQCDRYDLDKIESFHALQGLANKSIETRILKTITTVQEQFGVDIFGFGEDMYRQDTEAYKKVRDHWDEEFKKAKVTVISDLKIRRTGIRTKSFLKEIPSE